MPGLRLWAKNDRGTRIVDVRLGGSLALPKGNFAGTTEQQFGDGSTTTVVSARNG